MEALIRFRDLSHANSKSSATDPNPSVQPTPWIPEEIEKLRHRLISGEFRDPVEVTNMIVGELVYLTYKDLLTTKRTL